jgi:acetyl-CoA carboxylase carboxyltransferase component
LPLSQSSELVSPQQRLEGLCDARSVHMLDADATTAAEREVGVRAARGEVNGSPIVCYAQDSSISAGAVGVAEAEVIVRALRLSRAEGVPMVGFLESAGARLQEGAAALGGFGRIFFENVALSGRAPQISVITGVSAGGGCYSPALTDFVVMTERASMFLTGPRIVRRALGEEVSTAALGGTRVHTRNGVCDFVARDDAAAAALLRELLGYLPMNASTSPPAIDALPPAAGDPAEVLPPLSRNYYDVREVIARIVDGGRFQEVSERWARNMVVGFARLEGNAVAIVANQARHRGGIIDVQASRKGSKFIRTCDAFGIPLLVLVDTPGFMPGSREEAAGVISHGADLLRAFAGARTPRVTVIVRKAFGGAFITMNSKDLGADASFCWPDAEIGIMSAQAAVEIIHGRRLLGRRTNDLLDRLASRYAKESLTPEAAIGRGAVDAIIEPAETRERVLAALRLPRAAQDADERLTAGVASRVARRDGRLKSSYRLTTATEGAQP